MKKTKWKWLSFVLAAGMVLGLMPQGALAAEESAFLSAAEEEEIVTLGDGPAYEYTAQPGGEYGVVVVDERNQNKSKGKVSFALDFEPTAVEIIDYNSKTVVWRATKNQVKNNGKTWTDIELPASENPYQVRAWYINPKDKGPEFAGSYQFRVTNCIRNVQVINVGNVQTDEDFVYGSFDDMVTYGANYRVDSVNWLVYDRSDNFCDPTSALDIKTASKEGDVIRCEKGKKYRLKIHVIANERSVFEKTDPNQGIQIGENKQFEMVLANAGGWEVSMDYSRTTADNMLEIVTEPIDAGEEYRFTEQPASLTTVEPDAANKGAVIRWKVNFPQTKVRVYFGNPMENTTKFTEVEGDFNNIGFNVHGSAKGKELRLRSYYGDGDGDYLESQPFRVAEVIREVSIGGLVRPEEGAAPQTKDSFVIDEDAPYTLTVGGWIKGGSSDAVTKFERPGSYYACFVLSPKPGYIFDATNNSGNIKSVKINGKEELADQGGCLSLNKGNTLEVYSTAFTLNEQWTATFDANGGTGTMEALKVDKGKELTLPWCDFTAPAATSVFEGWQVGDDTETLYTPLSKVELTADTTIKASWAERDMVIVTISSGDNATGETVIRKMPDKSLISVESEEMKGFAPKEGYQFSFWDVKTSKNSFAVTKKIIDGKNGLAIEIQGDTTITYECEAIAGYTLRFDGDGGTGTMASIEAASGKEITLPACAFTHPDGKRFLGWLVTEDKENPGPSQLKKPGETIVSTVNMLAKPKWSAKSYWNITVAPGAGTGDAYTDAVVRGEAYKTPGCFFTAPAGQIFDKWEIGPGVYAAAGEQISIAGDITITAIWKKSQEEPEDQPDPKTLEGDVVVKTGDTYEKYSSLADAFAAITKKNNKSGEYEIYVNKALDEKTFKLPAKAKKITLTTQGEGKIRTQVLTVNVKCDLILNADMACSKTGKRIAFKMAKDANLTVNKGFDTLGKLSGNKATSKLSVNDYISVPSVMSFQSVSMGNAGLVSIADKGRLTNIVTFNGRAILGIGSVMNITEAGKAELMLTRDANGTLPKLTVAKVTTELSVETDINLEAGETVLKTGKDAIDCTKIIFPETALAAFRYNREIRAEYPDALTIGTKDYPSLEKAYADMTDESVDYIINLNRELIVKKLTLPKKLKSLTVNGNGHTILAGTAVSVNPRYALTFRNLKLTVFKMGKAIFVKDVKFMPVNINALGGLLLEDVDIYAKTANIRGKGNLDIGYVSVYNFVNDVMTPAAIDQISGFTTATVTGPISIRKPFVVPTITLKSLAEVTLAANTATITAKKSLTGESGSKIILQTALKPITLSNDASGISGTITLDPGSVAAGTQLFATRMPVEKLNEVITVLNGTLKAGKPGKVLLEKTGA